MNVRSLFESKVFVWVVIGVIASAVAYAAIVVGSPGAQRAVQFDQRRVDHLRQISWAVEAYWSDTGRMPSVLEDLRNGRNYVEAIHDPKTGEPYEYRALTERTYELCATFETDSSQYRTAPPRPFPEQSWEHGIGRTCFERTVPERNPGAHSQTAPPLGQ